jgi:hypothetical protein
MQNLRPPKEEDQKDSLSADDLEAGGDASRRGSNEQITVSQVNRARASWFVAISAANMALLILGLVLPSWVSISVPYDDYKLDVHGTITYLFGLKGATVTGIYNSAERQSYISFEDYDAAWGTHGVRSANSTIALVIMAAVFQAIGVLLYRRTTVEVDGRKNCRTVSQYLSVFLSVVLELAALLAYHVGNEFVSQQRQHAIRVVVLGYVSFPLIL